MDKQMENGISTPRKTSLQKKQTLIYIHNSIDTIQNHYSERS